MNCTNDKKKVFLIVPVSCFDVTSIPPVPISRGHTVIFDNVEYVLMEWVKKRIAVLKN